MKFKNNIKKEIEYLKGLKFEEIIEQEDFDDTELLESFRHDLVNAYERIKKGLESLMNL